MIAEPAEAEAFLAANPDVAFIDALYTTMTGVPRGKRLRRHELAGVFSHGRYLPGSLAVVDINGRDCEATGLVWEDGDADRLAKPIPGTLVRAPWLGPDVAQVLLSFYELDGRWHELDPRQVLSRVVDRFAELELTPVVACELEFYVVARRANGEPARLPTGKLTSGTPIAPEVYSVTELDEHDGFLRDLYAAAEAQGLPIEAAISEYAPGQWEIGLKHRADALRVGDDAIMFKRLVKGCALKHGVEATFMAKPFADRAGSGQHLHLSLSDAAGRNLFAAGSDAADQLMRQAIGGMMQLMPAGMAVLAPNANSWRRFVGNAYAPTAAIWGINNRTVALRVTAGPAEARHIEHRIAGADANPYLGLAVMLAGAHHGIVNKIDPGPPVTGDGYAQAGDAPVKLPRHWHGAVDVFEASDVLRGYLGDAFVRNYTTVKRTEQDRFFAEVPLADYDWCLRNA